MAEERHRVVVFGAGRVGKTAIVNRFLHGTFPEHYKATVEDLHCREYDIKGAVLKVDVLDTSGDLAFPAMRRLSISTAHAFILVYSIDSSGSFEVVKQIWEQIKEQRSNYQDLPCVFVGNKDDLLDNKRQVDYDAAQDWARAEGMESAFMEVSAKINRDIHIIFHKLLDQANIPELRKLEPILKRRLSANSGHMSGVRERLRIQDEGKSLSRSRSLIRRSNKPKLKQTGDPSRNDCVIS